MAPHFTYNLGKDLLFQRDANKLSRTLYRLLSECSKSPNVEGLDRKLPVMNLKFKISGIGPDRTLVARTSQNSIAQIAGLKVPHAAGSV